MSSWLAEIRDPVPFALVDVFGSSPLSGNPLAVVDACELGGEGPPSHWMQQVAREMNQAETTFVLPARSGRAHKRLRSFTAGGVEVFGAGHNALGAWWWLLATGRVPRPDDGVIVQEIGDRLLEVRVGDSGRLTMAQTAAAFGAEAEPSAVAAAVGLAAEDLDPEIPPRVVGTGADHLMVGIASNAALDAAAVDKKALVELARHVGAQGVYLAVVGDRRPVATASARFFNPGSGLDEDPATGSAAGPLAAYLAHLGILDRTGELLVHQGESMQRPSTIAAFAGAGGEVTVSGSAVLSAEGRLCGPSRD
ncbi:PhzF family phenazine biosynthesis protein [Saccharopolyspora erythraea]|uniref:PhzF family phenazine biosynthesis protein n=1 Tax=Saccharopolyspora erythraea TaxID=1836 RepID=UPI001BA5BBA2|nr:PhzF family phenazine biosynthesis protein [Saccharopolyspora erythraea]QUH03764.1 PhzF family phenazine biosynthesis protein [Saccharopolyspora erythraea]